MDIILTHENADFDAVAALLAAARLHPDYVPIVSERLNQNVARFLTLYGSAFPFVRPSDLRTSVIKQVLLVDAQRLPQVKRVQSALKVSVIDHHPAGDDIQAGYEFVYEPVGAVTTYLVEQIRAKGLSISPLEATLFMLGIYEDTGSLSYGTTTPRDLQIAAWLLEQQAVLDTVRRFLSHPLNPEQQSLLERLLQQMETRSVQGYLVSLSAVTLRKTISEVSAVVHRLRDLLDSAALFVIVTMPSGTLLVARSVENVIDVGHIARMLGGGGHGRAAAATIRDKTQAEIITAIWRELDQKIAPIAQVVDLMSYGVQTVDVDQPLHEVIRRLRQIGHEGYPVLEAGRVVGLLTRRDLDRADEHKLRELRVRDVMQSGNITVTRETSVFELERLLLETGWGQVPVIDANHQLIGIVTRTDLLKYWVKTHPSSALPERTMTLHQIETMLGMDAAKIVQCVSEQAHASGIDIYLVGGVVRDLLLGRANFDIDFVVEGDAIRFAESISNRFGGEVTTFKPFGTAKWKPKSIVAHQSDFIEHIDFASSRFEFYEHPTALPTVYNSSIKLDLQRRDFTINTLAIRLSPAEFFGQVMDFYGGLRDLDRGLIRVLHSLSFIDDPTRILRAVRFEHRLGFQIESRTDELMTTALPMLGRITGERLRNELTLLLHEDEPEKALFRLQERGILSAIHSDLSISPQLMDVFETVRHEKADGFKLPLDVSELYWHIWAAFIKPSSLHGVCDRLLFARKMAASMFQLSKWVHDAPDLAKADVKPSAVFALLEGTPEIALVALWYVTEDTLVRERLQHYWQDWRHRQPFTTGDTLRERGIKPGKCYSIILRRLREAWIDDAVHTAQEEARLLNQLLLDERICDGDT